MPNGDSNEPKNSPQNQDTALDQQELPNSPSQSAGAIIKSLETTVWAFRIYEIDNENCKIQFRNLDYNLKHFFKNFGNFSIEIKYKEAHLIENKNDPVWNWDGTDTSLLHCLYMESIKGLEIQPAYTKEEMVKFLKILSADYNSYNLIGEDIASMTWKAELKSLKIKTHEGLEHLETIDLTDRKNQKKTQEYVNHFLEKISSKTLNLTESIANSKNFENIITKDLSNLSYPEEIPVCSTAKQKLIFVQPNNLQEIDSDIEKDRKCDFLPKTVQALFEVLEIEKNEKNVSILLNYTLVIIDEYLDRNEWTKLRNLINALRAYAKGPGKAFETIVEQVIEQLAVDFRILKIKTFLLNADKLSHLDELTQVLIRLPHHAATPLLATTFQIPRGPVRRSLLNILIQLGKGQEYIFNPMIEKLDNEDLPDLIYILSHLDFEKTLPQLLRLAQDCTGKAKETALMVLMPCKDSKVRSIMIEVLRTLEDSDEETDKLIKIAIRYFSFHQDPEAIQEIKDLVESKLFPELPLNDQIRYFKVLGEIGGKNMLSFFKEILEEEGNLFSKKSLERKKVCAISGLAKIRHPEVKNILLQESKNEKSTPKVRNRCKIILSAIRDLENSKKETL